MSYRILFFTIILLVNTVFSSAQELLVHSTNDKNTKLHISTIDHPALNGKPAAVVIITQVFGKYNPNEVGVWYSGGKWKIFNQNRAAMPLNTRFNVLAFPPGTLEDVAVHKTSANNTRGHITTLDHQLTNANADALLFVTQRYGKYNTSPVGAWYNGNKWKIYNENRSKMPLGTTFNVLVLKKGKVPSRWNQIEGNAFTHTVTASSRSKYSSRHVSLMNRRDLTNASRLQLFTTQQYKNQYNTSTTGTWYARPNWTVFNQDRKPIPENVVFNVLALQKMQNSTPLKPVVLDKSVIANRQITSAIKPKISALKNFSSLQVVPFKPGVRLNAAEESAEESAAAEDLDPLGPDVELGKDLGAMLGDAEPLLRKLNLFREVYTDRNENVSVLYYLPRNYNLKWEKASGEYSFYIYYLSANDDGRGEVVITAELTPNISADDIEVVEKLLSKKEGKAIVLRPLPLKDTPKVNFGNALNNFDVDEESISTNIHTDFLEPIIVSWKMERRVDDLIGAMMNNIGISGNVEFLPYNESDRLISIPLKMKVNNPSTYGPIEYASAAALLNGFQNPTDYPIRTEELVVIRQQEENYRVQSIPLDTYSVEPGSYFADFTESEKAALLQGDLINKVWVNYQLLPCTSCNDAVKEKVMGGTAGSRVNEIEVEVLSPLAYSGAASLKMIIKSVQGDPKGKSEVLLPIITIDQDSQSITGGELFLNDGETPDFQYQLVMINPNGETLFSEWINGDNFFIIIGEQTIKEHFELLAEE
jgi:hypothetical protein